MEARVQGAGEVRREGWTGLNLVMGAGFLRSAFCFVGWGGAFLSCAFDRAHG